MKFVVGCIALALVGCGKKKPAPAATTTGSASPVAAGSGSGSNAGSAAGGDVAASAGSGAGSAAAGAYSDADDLLSMASGTLVVHEPKGVDNSVRLWRLFDGNTKSDWGVDKDVIEKEPFVIELAGRAQLDTFVVDAGSIELPDRLPGKIKIEVSDKSATDGFETVAELQPKQPAADGMTFKASKAVPGRWVRVTFFDANPDDTTQQDIANLHGYGQMLTPDTGIDVTGSYQTNEGELNLKQTGTTVTGCRKGAKAPIVGGVEGRVVHFNWPDNGDGFEGPAIGVFGKGNQWMGYWPTKVETPGLEDIEIQKKLSDKPAACDDKKDPIETSLAAGRVRLYGIHFNTDSAKLKDESKTTLDAIKKILDAHADWKITIEGHTDSTSTHDHNQTLSEQRATTVRDYLVKAGIAADRLDTKGLAETVPVAPNTDALGRAQNRRVELVKH